MGAIRSHATKKKGSFESKGGGFRKVFLSGRREDRKREEKGTPALAILHGREEKRAFFFCKKGEVCLLKQVGRPVERGGGFALWPLFWFNEEGYGSAKKKGKQNGEG